VAPASPSSPANFPDLRRGRGARLGTVCSGTIRTRSRTPCMGARRKPPSGTRDWPRRQARLPTANMGERSRVLSRLVDRLRGRMIRSSFADRDVSRASPGRCDGRPTTTNRAAHRPGSVSGATDRIRQRDELLPEWLGSTTAGLRKPAGRTFVMLPVMRCRSAFRSARSWRWPSRQDLRAGDAAPTSASEGRSSRPRPGTLRAV